MILPSLRPLSVLSSETSNITSFISELFALLAAFLIAFCISLIDFLCISCILIVIISPVSSIIGIEMLISLNSVTHPLTRARLKLICALSAGQTFKPSTITRSIIELMVSLVSFVASLLSSLTTCINFVHSGSYVTTAWGIVSQLSDVIFDTIFLAIPKCVCLMGLRFCFILCTPS